MTQNCWWSRAEERKIKPTRKARRRQRYTRQREKKEISFVQPSHAGWLRIPKPISKQALADRNLWQTDVLHHRPHDGQTTRFCGEGVNLIRALAHEAPQAFNGIGTPNVAMHHLWEGVKRQEMRFIFRQTPHRFRIAQAVFPECSPPIG